MRLLQKNDSNISPNAWVISMIKALEIRLHGQKITIRIKDESTHSTYLLMLKTALTPLFLDKLDPNELNGITVKEASDTSKPNDVLVEIDYSNYKEPNPLNLTGLRALLKIWVKEVYFNDWKTTGKIDVRWQNNGLAVKIPFESQGNEVNLKKLGVTIKGNINGFYLDILLAPYIFWFPDIVPARDNKGDKLIDSQGRTTDYWASGKGMYKHRCAAFIDFGWDSFSPKIMDAEQNTRDTLTNLASGLPKHMPQDLLFQLFETLILGERALLNYNEYSKMRGLEIKPNDAKFLYIDEEIESFKGKGKIVSVRKDKSTNHLQDNEFGHLELRTFKGDNIIEVEVEDEQGKRYRISSLNLIDSILDGDAEIEDTHVVIRKASNWGTVANVDIPWKHLIERHLNMFGPWGKNGGSATIRYNGYLRNNPDSDKQNNLDNIQEYSYDFSDSLQKNLYDGTFFFVYPDLTAFSGLVRTLYPRDWKIPDYTDRNTEIKNKWIEA